VVGQAEHEVARESSRGQQDDPPRPFQAACIDHAIENQQEPQTGVGQGRGEGRGVDEVLDGLLLKEIASEMPDQAGDADCDRAPADRQADPAGKPLPPTDRPGPFPTLQRRFGAAQRDRY